MSTNNRKDPEKFLLQRTDFMSDIHRTKLRPPIAAPEYISPVVTPQQGRQSTDVLARIKNFNIKIRALLTNHRRQVFPMCLVVVFAISIIVPLIKPNQAQAEIKSQGPNSAASTGNCVNDTSIGTVAWSNPGQAYSSNNNRASVNLGYKVTSNYIKCTNFGFSLPASVNISGIKLGLESTAASASVNSAAVRLVKAGTIGSTDRSTNGAYPGTEDYEEHGSAGDLWGDSWTVSDINAANFGAAVAAKNIGGGTETARVDHIRLTVFYTTGPQIDQNGYIWENDDGTNNGSQQAAGNNAISGVRQGERLSLRTQIKNTGDSPLASDLALFYDQNDGNFVKVDSPRTVKNNGSGCALADWQCQAISSSIPGNVDESTLAFGLDGRAFAAFNNPSGYPSVAQYVGSGGTGCTATTAWTCTAVQNIVPSNRNISIAINPVSGVPYIAYGNNSYGLTVAQYVGTGGNCASNTWRCTVVDIPNGYDQSSLAYPTIAFSTAGVPYVSYSFADNITYVANYVGSGGSGCNTSAWRCTTLNAAPDTLNVGWESTILMSPTGTPYVVYQEQFRHNIIIAREVGSGGNCSGSSRWDCSFYFTPQDNKIRMSVALDPAGLPYIAYRDGNGLTIAQFVGNTAGTGCGAGVVDWTCTTVDSTVNTEYPSITFSPSGAPYISYTDTTNDSLKYARYVGSGGSGCSSAAWTCATVDTAGGEQSTIAFSPDGNPYISYRASSSLKIASLQRAGAITFAPSVNGGSITSSHADMTTATDAGNRADADCIGGGTWQDGVVATAPVLAGYSLAAGKCTELAFTIDTSQAVAGTTYRFIIAGADNWQQDKGKWRGPTNVAQYATLSVEADTLVRAAKNVEPQGGNCTAAEWACQAIDSNSYASSLAFSPSGTPYISYSDSSNNLKVAQYVGSGGTGCTSTAWQCTDIDSADYGSPSSLAFSPSGTPYISYSDSFGNFKVAQYVGSGGIGCNSTAWECTAIDSANYGFPLSIAFSPSGTPYISYSDSSGDISLAKLKNSAEKLITSTTYEGNAARNGTWAQGLFRLDDGRSPRSNSPGLCGAVAAMTGMCGIYNDDGNTDSITAQANERPVFTFTQKTKTNSELPSVSWIGRSTLAPNTGGGAGDLKLQVYRFGTTNAWEDLAGNSSYADCDSQNCKLIGVPSGGTISQYYEPDGSQYRAYFRLYQVESTSQPITLSTDLFQLQFLSGQMRHGTQFQNNLKRPFTP